MKRLLFTTVVLFALASFVFQMSSCKKQDPIPTPIPVVINFPIEGLWIGTYTVDGQSKVGEQYFSFVIKPDGTLITDTKGASVQHLAIGTWSLKDGILSCTYTYIYGISTNVSVTQTSTATWDKTGKLVGTWKNDSPLVTGTIALKRVN